MTPAPTRTTSSSPALKKLEQELLLEEIRHERAKAELAEIELAKARDVERDRSVKGGKIRHLNIHGAIYGMAAETWLDALAHWQRRDPGEPVEITINSPGGSITDGLALYDTICRMRRGGSRVVTRGQGMVASMAGVLLQAGDERVMDARAKMMIHEGSLQFSSEERLSPGEMEDMRGFQKMLLNDIAEILTERSTMSKTALTKRWKRRDWYLTAQEALSLGFVDRIE